MAEAGRVKHHIAHRISDPKNAILLVGYATPFSLAGQLLQGKEEVRIFGDTYPVKAEIHRMTGFSAHADYQEMLQYLNNSAQPDETKKIFLVHGQTEAMSHFTEVLNGNGFKQVVPCEWGKIYEL
jgi:metallo-beta-lactamase family protein